MYIPILFLSLIQKQSSYNFIQVSRTIQCTAYKELQRSLMNKTEEYGFGCMIGIKDDVEMLHIEVKSLRFPQETYSKHYTYEELPSNIRLIFKNLAQVFVFLERKQMIYFDQEQEALKLCLNIAGQVKEFSITLQPTCKNIVIRQKTYAFQQEKTKLEHDFRMGSIEKQERLQALRKQLEAIKREKTEKSNTINQLKEKNGLIQAQYQTIKKKCEQKTIQIRGKISKQSQVTFLSVNDYKKHQQRKKFWVQEISKLRKEKFQQLKTYINKHIDFQRQTTLFINHIKLTKMLFVEIFINLEILDLSNNAIVSIQGLFPLKKLMKLKLSQNRITSIPHLPRFQRLLELILNSNSIKKIENVFHLSSLQILNLSLNKIQAIPDDISKLTKLVELRLYHNHISIISEKVFLLKNLKIFSAMRNKFYNEGSKGREIINRMLKNGIRTAIQEVEQIYILE